MATHLGSNIFEIGVCLVKLLEGTVRLLARFSIIISRSSFASDIQARVYMRVHFGKVPRLVARKILVLLD